jgi:hypothetical protein
MASLVRGRSRLARAVMFTAMLAFPLLGANECALTEPEENFDGTYTLETVNGYSMPFNMQYIDGSNKLVLTSGSWTIIGTTLYTKMSTYMVVSGKRTPTSGSTTENHTGTISVSGSSATATLDNGTKVYATIEDGQLLFDQYGNTLKFRRKE